MRSAINSVNLNKEKDFPYLVLDVKDDVSLLLNPGFRVMHWHEDLQFIYVKEGNIGVKTLDEQAELKAGEGIFINKNVIHTVYRRGSCQYNSFIFPEYLIKFYPGCPAFDAVTLITESNSVGIRVIKSGDMEDEKALSYLKELSELEKNKGEFYEYNVLSNLCGIWMCIIKSIGTGLNKKNSIKKERMEKFLRYILENYNRDISLEELAESANVSKSECMRCFKESMNTTPWRYIMDFRLYTGAELLRNSDKSIQDIADAIGFGQSSYFGKCFKGKTGMSPREYRNKNS